MRNISFAITTIRSLDMEHHVCHLSIRHNLLLPKSHNNTDNATKWLCPKEKNCTIIVDSRFGRIIPKCNLEYGITISYNMDVCVL